MPGINALQKRQYICTYRKNGFSFKIQSSSRVVQLVFIGIDYLLTLDKDDCNDILLIPPRKYLLLKLSNLENIDRTSLQHTTYSVNQFFF